MSVWDWIYDYVREAMDEGDERKLELWEFQKAASVAGKEDPDAMLDALRQGRMRAEQLGEKWWVLHFDHWRLQALLHYKLDYTQVLELATRATLEARKPAYATLPQRICLHEDLIYAYMGIDPLGHAEAIGKALDYMQEEITPDLDCRYCVQNCRTEFALLRNDLEQAETSARITLEMASEDGTRTGEHHAVFAQCDLCDVAHRRRDWASLETWSVEGERLARRNEEPLKLAEFLVWQALVARHSREEATAHRRLNQALTRASRSKSLPGTTFYNAVCTYHEMGGELEQALDLRTLELERLLGKGRLHDECRCRIERCRLLAQLGRPVEEERAAAEAAAGKLRDPAPMLRKLQAVCPHT